MPRKVTAEIRTICAMPDCGGPVYNKPYKTKKSIYCTTSCFYEHAKLKAHQRLVTEQSKWN